MEIPNYELDEWLEALQPYQKDIIKELVDIYGVEIAIEKWISANGPVGIVKFGGDGNVQNMKFSKRFKHEINKFICGHPDYANERGKFGEQGEVVKKGVISIMSASIGAHLGVSAAMLAPVIVLTLYLVGKMSVKAYCTGIGFE